MATPPPPSTSMPADGVTVLSADEWREAGFRALARLGLTYDELADQARNKNFGSTAARKLWMLVGGTI